MQLGAGGGCRVTTHQEWPPHLCQVEFILMGGTFMSLPTEYRDYFVRNLHDALSGHASSSVAESVRCGLACTYACERARGCVPYRRADGNATRCCCCRYSEESRTKCIGMTIETRPDFCLTPHLTQMLSYGCTRLEIGLQSTYEDVARDTNRGHTVAAVGECFHLAKNAGFKVCAALNPALHCAGLCRTPGVTRAPRCR